MMDNMKDYDRYESGKRFNYKLDPNPYTVASVNWDFFSGIQWPNAGLSPDLPQPVFNIIARAVTFFVSSITATGTKVQFSLLTKDGDEDIETVVNSTWNQFVERVKGEWKGIS